MSALTGPPRRIEKHLRITFIANNSKRVLPGLRNGFFYELTNDHKPLILLINIRSTSPSPFDKIISFSSWKIQIFFLKWGKPQPLHQNDAYGFY
jgi:hypothetical protein